MSAKPYIVFLLFNGRAGQNIEALRLAFLMIRDPPATSISIITDKGYFVNCALYPNAKCFRVYFYDNEVIENVKIIKFNAPENISID